jgi:hypothetical protein
LVSGKTVGIDATTLEANAALRSIVRRDTGESYQDFLTKLAQASGIETPTRADLALIDQKRKNKGKICAAIPIPDEIGIKRKPNARRRNRFRWGRDNERRRPRWWSCRRRLLRACPNADRNNERDEVGQAD